MGGDTLYNLAGFHYVFKLQGDSAVRLDKSMYHGIDHKRFLFSWKNKLYALGGYGMFLSHSTLKYFNKNTNEWSAMIVKGDLPPAITGICLKKDSLIFCFSNII